MRLLKLVSWMLLGGTLACFTNATNARQVARIPGRIIAAKVHGTVVATRLADQSKHTLTDNDTVAQHTVITTGKAASVILVFSNGATIDVGAESTLSIDEFLQDPFEKEVAVASLTAEPTSSVTKLNLSRGELVGNVKHLRQDEGSSFTVNTPVGAAGIRGTTFRIVFRPDLSGKVIFTLSTAEGAVLFQSPAAGVGVSVETGKEIVIDVEVSVDAATGKVTITAPPKITGVNDIPAATQAIIAAAVQQIIEQSSKIIIPAAPAGSNNNSSSDPPKTDEQKTNSEKNTPSLDDTIPAPNTPASQTTHGDGQPG